MKPYYATLGLTEEASVDEVKQAWRRLASQHHPDREGGSAEEFNRCQAAYSKALEDAEARAKFCHTCGGTGQVRKARGWTHVMMPCPECGGKGELS